jgi:predicted Zn-dependent protease
MKRLFIVLSAPIIFLLLTFSNLYVGLAQSTCATLASFHGWAKCSIVYYCYDSTITSTQRTQFDRAISTWNSVSQSNNTKVKFQAASGTSTCALVIKNDNSVANMPAVTDPSGSNSEIHNAMITFYPNGVFVGTTTKFYDPSQASTYSTIWEKALLHEIGHTLGLDHLTGYARPCDDRTT